MRDKRPVDELSIEELERILRIRKREARLNRLRGYEGRQVRAVAPPDEDEPPLRRALPPEVDVPGAGEAAIPAADESRAAPAAEAPPQPNGAGRRAARITPTRYYDGAPQFEDELDERFVAGAPRRAGRDLRRWWNRALFAVEIVAAAALILLLIGLFQSYQEIEQTTANLQAEYEATSRAAFVPPTPTPMINIAAVVLPSGHTFVDNEAVFNLDEIPAQYRDQYVAFAARLAVSRPTPAPEGPIRIRIPRLNVDSAVVAGDDPEALKLGVGHHLGSANPGERGNMVLSAHNDVYGEIFRHLDQLQPGDQIIVSTRARDYVYQVQPVVERGQTRGHRIVMPTDTWVLGASGDARQLTLISCYPYRVNTRRIVVFATLMQ